MFTRQLRLRFTITCKHSLGEFLQLATGLANASVRENSKGRVNNFSNGFEHLHLQLHIYKINGVLLSRKIRLCEG